MTESREPESAGRVPSLPGSSEPGSAEPAKRPSAARERLLDAAFRLLSEQGVGDASLRELAAALGTSHRMLIYHFGSREGLLADIVKRTEQWQRDALADLVTGMGTSTDAGLEEVSRAFWQRLADPALAPVERLFFEMYGQALQGRPWAAGMLPDVVEQWLPSLTELFGRDGTVDGATAAARARMSLAMARGLLLDLLATGDRGAVQAAFEEFVALVASPGPTGRGPTMPGRPGPRTGA